MTVKLRQILIFGVILIALAGSKVSGSSQGSPIPGIDSIPQAVPHERPEYVRNQEEQAEEPEKSEETDDGGSEGEESPTPAPTIGGQVDGNKNEEEEPKKDLGEFADKPHPHIRGIKAVHSQTVPDSVEISWRVHPENDTAIYIVRYNRPISDEERLFNALNITSPPLGPQETNFVDRGLPEGTYYYAVVTSWEISRDGTLVLEPNQNFSKSPLVMIPGQKNPEQQMPVAEEADLQVEGNPEDYQVKSLVAFDTENSVRLSWSPAKAKDIEYNVFRGDEPFVNEPAFKSAQRLSVLKSDVLSFEDVNPVSGKRVFYGVSATSIPTGKVYNELVLDQSFITHTFTGEKKEAGSQKRLPEGFKADVQDNKSIHLTWKDPDEKVTGFYIFRAEGPIFSEDRLNEAINLGFVRPGVQEYTDTPDEEGVYYYALIPIDQKGDEIRELIAGKSFTGAAATLKKETVTEGEDQYLVTNLKAMNLKDSVKLEWNSAIANNIYYTIYRVNRNGAENQSVKLGNAREDSPRFVDNNPLPGTEVYYVVTVTSSKDNQEHRVLKFNQSFIKHTFTSGGGDAVDENTLPGTLVTYQDSADSVKIMWVDPSAPVQALQVYRHTKPINSMEELNRAKMTGTIKAGVSEFYDRGLTEGSYFYGIFPVNARGELIRAFVAGKTYTDIAVNIRGKRPGDSSNTTTDDHTDSGTQSGSPTLTDFRGEWDGRLVRLNWTLENRYGDSIKYFLYRSRRPMKNFRDVRRNGRFMEELPSDQTSYRDQRPYPGNNYYAILIESNGKLLKDMREGKNFLSQPVFIRGRSSIMDNRREGSESDQEYDGYGYDDYGSEDWDEYRSRRYNRISDDSIARRAMERYGDPHQQVNAVIAETYVNKHYDSAIPNLMVFAHDRQFPDEVRAKAMFYIGLSYFHMREYRRSLIIFMSELVKHYYPERSRFWYTKNVERLR